MAERLARRGPSTLTGPEAGPQAQSIAIPIQEEVFVMFKKILVAVDGSDYSRQALPAALEVAKKFESDVFVLHVAEHDRGRAAAFTIESPAEATRLVADAVKSAKDAGLNAAGEVHDRAVGHVAIDVVETARAHGSDLIVMGSRGLSDVQGLLLGSVTHKVMQLAHIAVLVVSSPEKVKAPAAAAAGFAAVPHELANGGGSRPKVTYGEGL
jgi:nucleotide-binding universal stress UspA family protein